MDEDKGLTWAENPEQKRNCDLCNIVTHPDKQEQDSKDESTTSSTAKESKISLMGRI